MFEAKIWENLALSECYSNVSTTWTLPLDKAMGISLLLALGGKVREEHG